METQTAVSLNTNELQALLELARVATPRLSIIEQLYFDGLLTRFATELEAQIQDMQPPAPAIMPPDVPSRTPATGEAPTPATSDPPAS